MKTINEVRRLFWEWHPQFKSHFRITWRQNQYNADIRTAFVDFVDMLRKDNQISENLANKVTL